MSTIEDGEKRLRATALQNAKTILQAQHRAEAALKKQSELLRITLASMSDAVITTDSGGGVAFMNGVAEQLTGWTQPEANGRPLPEVLQLFHERSRQPLPSPAETALAEAKSVVINDQTVLVGRSGRRRLIEGSAAPMRDEAGASLGAVLLFRDVTERKWADKTRARLAAIVEASDDAIVSKTLDGIIRSWNAGAERLFGYTAKEAVGQSITMIIPPDRLDEEKEILRKLSQGERLEHFETVRMAKDGRRIDISLTVSPLLDENGQVVGASKVARDITERKRVEAAQRDADRRKDEFLALLAHELRNPLAPLRNGLQVLRLAGRDPEIVGQIRGMMDRQLEHMVRLIDDLLDISRISQSKIDLRRTRVNLAEVIDAAVETARPTIEAECHELSLALPAEPVYLDADATRLAQVFSNLLTNSAKYTRRGGHIWINAKRQGDEVAVSVTDNGIGIPGHAISNIFNMFTQVDRNIERATGGLGIGLALVKGLVEMHGGTVTAESQGPGRGSTFTVRLPALPAGSAPAPAPRQEPGLASSRGRRILVVDDNADSARTLAKLLRLLGNDVQSAGDGLEAIEKASEIQPDVILMDVGMPGLNGYEATRRIRQQSWGNRPLIIALTGWGQEGDRLESKQAGCNGHLVKPVSLQDLDQMLEELTVEAAGRDADADEDANAPPLPCA